jgi:negative regulator of sigma E activity
MMTRSLRAQFASFGLAAAVTLATLMGLHTLAQSESAAAQMAVAAANHTA